jgi:hypothetical protein
LKRDAIIEYLRSQKGTLSGERSDSGCVRYSQELQEHQLKTT